MFKGVLGVLIEKQDGLETEEGTPDLSLNQQAGCP